MSQDFLQLCYVTNDFERAIDQLRSLHSIGPFKELRDHRVPTSPGKAAVAHFGLAFKADTQFEIVEPLSEEVGIYRDFLVGDDFQMRFHHIGRHIASYPAYVEALREYKARWSVPIDMSHFGGHYAYADSRAEFGHYLELLCFPGDALPTSVPRY